MFSLILYCGLISFVVSAHFNIKDGNEFGVKTTVSTLASTMIPAFEDCVLEMEESEIPQIGELYKSNLINLVDIHVLFSNSSHDKEDEQLLSDFHVSLVHPAAVFALYVSALPWFSQWSYTVGIRNAELNIKWNQKDCIRNERDVTNFARKFTEHIVLKLNLVTFYEAYFSFKRASFEKPNRTCVVTTNYFFPIKFNHQEPKLSLLWSLQFTFSLSVCMFACFCYNFRSATPFSRSFILYRIFWKENGELVSVVRRFVITSVWVYSNFLIFFKCECSVFSVLSFLLFIFIPSVVFTLSPLFTTALKRLDVRLEKCLTSKFFFVNYCCHLSCFVCTIVSSVYFLIVILILWFEATILVNGLILNLNYFFPYFASIFVFLFYWSNYSKTIEKKNAITKRVILEACRETEGITTLSLANTDPKPSKGLLVIMPEEAFPYYTDLLYFGKMCFFFVFSCGIFKFARMESELNFVLQAVTTAGLGAVPHILNQIALETSEERKGVYNEQFKLNVKHKLEELILENPGSTIAVTAGTQLTTMTVTAGTDSLKDFFLAEYG